MALLKRIFQAGAIIIACGSLGTWIVDGASDLVWKTALVAAVFLIASFFVKAD